LPSVNVQLAKTGKFTVLLGARSSQVGNEAAAKINEKLGTNVVKFVPIDVSNEESVKNVKQHIFEITHNKPLDVLINNAGVATYTDFTQEKAKEIFATNVYGVQNLTDTLLKENAIAKGGKVIILSSRMGQVQENAYSKNAVPKLEALLKPVDRHLVDRTAVEYVEATANPDQVEDLGFWKNPYCTSKAVVNAYARALAKEQEGNVYVYYYCPGWCHTDMGGANAPGTPESGAVTGLWLATEDPSNLENGVFYGEKNKIRD
jgi:NAD(P)-dependent dehydrogenase (short-subunit alcohol dehydrogenase family)